MDKIVELKKDIQELERLAAETERSKVRDIISIEIRKLVTECTKFEENKSANAEKQNGTSTVPSSARRYETKINNYAWDQTNSTLKIYITFDKANTIPNENIKCSFAAKSVTVKITDFGNKDYVFTISNLLRNIKPDAASYKLKSDMIILLLPKVEAINWSHVTELEKRAKDANDIAPEVDKTGDPSDGLMSIMKSMYDKGDDNMKRTIAQAWTEAQTKKSAPL